MKILEKKVSLSVFFLFISNYIGSFISYGRYLKYISFIMIIIYFMGIFYVDNIHINIKKDNISKDFIILSIIFVFLSALYQLYYGEPQLFTRTIEEVLFIILPAILVFLFSNLSIYSYDKIFKNLLIILIAMFIVKYNRHITINNILSISFANSFSPFESEYADYFMFLFMYFVTRGNRKEYILSFIFGFLCLKRLNLIIMIIYYLYEKFNRKRKNSINGHTKILMILLIIFNIVGVLVLLMMTSDSFSDKFYEMFNKSLNQFTLGRFYLINYIKNNPYFLLKGFGSSSVFIKNIGFDNIHLDNLKIYFELGMIGIIIFYFYYYRSVVKYPKILLIMVLYNFMYYVTFTLSNIMSNFLLLLLVTALKDELYNCNNIKRYDNTF